MTEEKLRITSLAELDSFAGALLETLPRTNSACLLALSGELGAGKTAFVQTLARRLGVRQHVVSPTFMIMRTYETAHEVFKELVHIDAYRVEDVREMEVLNIPELFTKSGTLVCIEWPERIAPLVPAHAFNISFEITDGTSRLVTYSHAS